MSWEQEYKSKLCTAADAVQAIRSGNRLVLGHAAGIPTDLVDAMVANHAAYRNVEVVHMFCLGEGHYMDPEMAPHFRHNALFVGPNARKAVEEGRADFIPVFFHEIPRLFVDGTLPAVS